MNSIPRRRVRFLVPLGLALLAGCSVCRPVPREGEAVAELSLVLQVAPSGRAAFEQASETAQRRLIDTAWQEVHRLLPAAAFETLHSHFVPTDRDGWPNTAATNALKAGFFHAARLPSDPPGGCEFDMELIGTRERVVGPIRTVKCGWPVGHLRVSAMGLIDVPCDLLFAIHTYHLPRP